MGFKKSLAIGNKGQQILIDLLTSAGFDCQPSVGKCIGWDVKATFDNFVVLIECKSDEYSAKSGNIAIEHWNSSSDKPSGLTATIADVWVTLCPGGEVWAVNTNKLKKYCQSNQPLRTIIGGGDKNSNMWLYKKPEITSIFVRLDELGQENIVGCLRELIGESSNNEPKE